MFEVGETLVIGAVGYVLLRLGFHPAPILLGFVLVPRFEDNFRRAMLIAHGDFGWFMTRPISAFFLTLCAAVVLGQLYVRLRRQRRTRSTTELHHDNNAR
jgi:TctA family transporter